MAHHVVFVYGTLMRGQHHHDKLAHAEFLGPATTLPAYDLVRIDYYPALLPGGSMAVTGELFRVDDATLAALDELEEVPSYYERVAIVLADGSEAQTYLMPRERAGDAARIASGDFRVA